MIEITDLVKSFGQVLALDGIGLRIPEGSFYCLLGPSGCGKTTLLRCLAGLEQPNSGSMAMRNRNLLGLPAHKRGLSLVFQNYALWPHLDVGENIGYGLRVKGMSRSEREGTVSRLLRTFRLEGLEARLPGELSGGQQQRVALARAMAVEPEAILMDEPLSNLDAHLRRALRRELKAFHRESGKTIIYVTHDQEEAMSLSDRIAILEKGRLVAEGPPGELYRKPPSLAAALFLGEMNAMSGQTRMGRFQVQGAQGSLVAPEGTHTLCFRPEHAIPVGPDFHPKEGLLLETRLRSFEFMGTHQLLLVDAGARAIQVRVPPESDVTRESDATLHLHIPEEMCLLYPDSLA